MVFEKSVVVTKIVIGARKSDTLWNYARYYNVKAYIDEKFVTATGTDHISGDWTIQFDFPPTIGRRVELIWFYQYAQVATIYVHYQKLLPHEVPKPIETEEEISAENEVEILDQGFKM